jgi:L-ascorbate metabolism protein UlaG (beta-lactamase superfamily)
MTRRQKILLSLLGTAGAVAGGGALAGWLLSAPRYRGPKSDHFDGRRFHNLEPTTHAGFLDMLKWMTSRDEGPWDEWRDVAAAPKPPERVGAGAVRVTFINHASLLIQTENVNILTDPIWSERCSPVPFAGPKRHHPPGIRFEDLPPIDAVLVSHNHYDHLDVPSLQRLASAHRPRIFTALGNGAFLRARQIANGTELDWWQSDAVGGVRIHVVPAQHFSSRGLADRDANLWCGYVIETPHGSIYFAGDTGWGSHFERIRERFAPIRVAMLPIGAFRPVWFMRAVHISPGEAVRAAAALRAEFAIPMHYGTFHLGDDGQDEPVEVLRREGGGGFRVLKPGESLELR